MAPDGFRDSSEPDVPAHVEERDEESFGTPGTSSSQDIQTEGNRTVIEVSGLWKVFTDEVSARKSLVDGEEWDGEAALRGVSLDIHAGELVVMIGLSGSGKSTFVRCLNGLVHPTAGNLKVLGVDVTAASTHQLRALRTRIGMIFQHFALLPHRTVLSNVALGLELRGISRGDREARAAEFLELVGLGGREYAYPDELSGGQQQRVGLARALALDPDILLMDEPFSALDALIREDLRQELLTLQERLNKTIVFITHDVDEALALGDRIAVLHDGRLLQTGVPDEICFTPADSTVERFVRNVNLLGAVDVGAAAEPLDGPQPPMRIDAARPIADAMTLLGKEGCDRLMVVDANDRPVGVVTSKSVLRTLSTERRHAGSGGTP